MGPLFDASDRFSMVDRWYLVARRAEADGEILEDVTPEASLSPDEP
jgi:hypothetical protein